MEAYVLEIGFDFNGKEQRIYPVLLRNERELILVDCGYAGFLPLLEEAANKHNRSLQNLTGVVITHEDIDHVGGLFELKEKYPAVKVYASEIEAPYISGKEKSVRLHQAETLYPSLPEEQKPGALAFQEFLKTVRPVPVNAVLSENKPVPFSDAVQVINTPGHTPGHISLYLSDSKTLIAGDAVVIENGELEIANPSFCLDLPAAVASIKKLQSLAIDTIICFHGGVLNGVVPEKLRSLFAKYQYSIS